MRWTLNTRPECQLARRLAAQLDGAGRSESAFSVCPPPYLPIHVESPSLSLLLPSSTSYNTLLVESSYGDIFQCSSFPGSVACAAQCVRTAVRRCVDCRSLRPRVTSPRPARLASLHGPPLQNGSSKFWRENTKCRRENGAPRWRCVRVRADCAGECGRTSWTKGSAVDTVRRAVAWRVERWERRIEWSWIAGCAAGMKT